MKTINYQILLDHGLKRVAGEPANIPNDLGMTFGIHCNAYRAFDDELRFVVTHIESGQIVGKGAMRGTAINDARERIKKAIAKGTMEADRDRAIRIRAEVIAAHPEVFG